MQQLLCEPEDRLGSQTSASVSRPNSIVVQSRRSGFIPQPGVSAENDGAHLIKVIEFPLQERSTVKFDSFCAGSSLV